MSVPGTPSKTPPSEVEEAPFGGDRPTLESLRKRGVQMDVHNGPEGENSSLFDSGLGSKNPWD